MIDLQKIKEELKKRKMTYEDLSALSGIPLGTLSAIFSGRNPQPRLDTLNAIIYALNIELKMPNNDDGLTIPENLQNIRFAFHDGLDGLTQEDIDEVSRYVEFLKSKKKK